ncbi:MAG: GGDEF domain-containing protein [Oceanospirillaceae bacterium]
MLKNKFRVYAELDLDAVFEDFYKTMLSNADFSDFFKDQDQIRALVSRQKQFFLDTIESNDEVIKQRYITLGEMHHSINVPYIDFMAGMGILERGVIHSIVLQNTHRSLLDFSFQFFHQIRAFTAKGYLNKMLCDDIADIDLYLSHVNRATEIDTLLATERIIWLKSILRSIKIGNRATAPSFNMPEGIASQISAATQDDPVLLKYTDDISRRMEINARNLFFFLEKESYEEVLPLYRELMSIYKLTLMLTSVVSIASANTIVETLSRDKLTGLLTRQTYESVMNKTLGVAAAEEYELSFIMVDIDSFKSINDQYGHACGDEVLSEIASTILNSIRATDYAFRLGGDEFLLLLKGASYSVAALQAEQMRKQIACLKFKAGNQQAFSVTASFGISSFAPPFDLSISEMVAASDKKLYLSKNKGRNSVS